MSQLCEGRRCFGVNRLFVSMVLILLSARLGAQMGTATLSGIVTDPSGSAIPAAQVTLESATEKASRQTVTDVAGQYVIPAITPGTYELIVKAGGFQPQTLTGIVLASGQGSTLNVSMKVSEAVQEMTVNEAPPLLETTTATLGSVVNSNQFTATSAAGKEFHFARVHPARGESRARRRRVLRRIRGLQPGGCAFRLRAAAAGQRFHARRRHAMSLRISAGWA